VKKRPTTFSLGGLAHLRIVLFENSQRLGYGVGVSLAIVLGRGLSADRQGESKQGNVTNTSNAKDHTVAALPRQIP
jgi:hypothetical protein